MAFEFAHRSSSGRAIKTEPLVSTTANNELTAKVASMDHLILERKIFQRHQITSGVIDLTEDTDTDIELSDDTIAGKKVPEIIYLAVDNQCTIDTPEEVLLKNYALNCGHDSSKFVGMFMKVI
ncbi:hypothetical protein J6590_028612 [Homalodisca vitripennis]|nr:hypothetical protein J6590_028612 [Homalodisca vitripennis]